MFTETILTTAQPTRDILAALTSALGDYIVYEQGEVTFIVAQPVWEFTLHGGHDAPWDAVRDAIQGTDYAHDQAIYGWVGFELASGGAAGQEIAHFLIPGIEIRIAVENVTIRTSDDVAPDVVAQLRSIIESAAPYQPEPPRAVNVRALDQRYLDAVAAAVAEIQAGVLQKVILSRVVDLPFTVNMLDTYLHGRAANTPARSFLFSLGDWQAAGFSPETVVEVNSHGEVSTQPLAGTRALTGDAVEDEILRSELLADPKEIFEHAASVNLACEELSMVADANGPWVSEFMEIKPRGSVQHLGSRVNCRLAEGKNAWDALAVLFPAITASGIPKAPAYELIKKHETAPRMLYSGAVLRADSDGSLDAALVLRTVYQHAGKAWLRAGAGIVLGSTPAREHEETCEKLSSVAPYVVAQD